MPGFDRMTGESDVEYDTRINFMTEEERAKANELDARRRRNRKAYEEDEATLEGERKNEEDERKRKNKGNGMKDSGKRFTKFFKGNKLRWGDEQNRLNEAVKQKQQGRVEHVKNPDGTSTRLVFHKGGRKTKISELEDIDSIEIKSRKYKKKTKRKTKKKTKRKMKKKTKKKTKKNTQRKKSKTKNKRK